MTDILITHSFFLRFDPKQWRAMMPYPPLGTLYAAAVLERQGFSVALFDTMLAASEEELHDHCRRHRPAVVAIYDDDFNYLNKMCLSRMREGAFRMSEIAKSYGAFVVVHGSDATDHAEEYLAHSADAVIVGEGEAMLGRVCDQVLRQRKIALDDLPGVAFIRDGVVTRTKRNSPSRDLDGFPFPAWHLVDVEKYRETWMKHHGYFSLNMVTTRGCPYRCNWCAKPIYGQVYNSRSPENVVEELQYLVTSFAPDHIWFADDIFGLKPGWVQHFADLVGKKRILVRYKIQSRADLLLEPNTVESLARSGCGEAWIGAESGSQKILDAMEKGIRVSQIYEARQLLKSYGVRSAFFLQFGYPGETREDIEATIRMVRDLMPDDLGISVSYPLPGTKFYENVKAGLMAKKNWVDSNDLALMFRGTYSPAYYRRLHRYVHRVFRLRKGIREIVDLIAWKTSPSMKRLRSAILVGFFAPASLLDRWMLFFLVRE